MAVTILGKQNLKDYFLKFGLINIRDISLRSLVYLREEELLSFAEIAIIFQTNIDVVEDIFTKNGLLN